MRPKLLFSLHLVPLKQLFVNKICALGVCPPLIRINASAITTELARYLVRRTASEMQKS